MDTLFFPFAYFRVEIYAKNSDMTTLNLCITYIMSICVESQ